MGCRGLLVALHQGPLLAYEEEYRQFISLPAAISDGGLYFVPFGPDLILKEVILGVRCTEDLLAVRKRVRARHGDGVVTFPARLAWTSFHMVPQESNVP